MAGNEVKAVHRHDSGTFATGRGRLTGFLINHASGASGDVVIYDNASAASGDEILEIDEKTAGLFGMEIPGDGILFYNGLYATLPANVSLTLFIQK
jgi:hypothetical protein